MKPREKKLLKRFVKTGDADAFSQIVNTHSGLVYGACLRILDDRDLAMDVAQETFFQLLKSASTITESLPAWLHRVATRKSINAIRENSRRIQREKKYSIEKPLSEPQWSDLSICVDEALNELDHESRDVLVKRFFEGRTMEDIAAEDQVSKATISRMVKAALQQMHGKLRQKGLIVAVGALSVMLAENAAQAAPAVLVTELGKMAIVGGSVAAVSGASSASAASGIGAGMLATVKAKIITAAAVATIGIGSIVTYNHVTSTKYEPASKPASSAPAQADRSNASRVYTPKPPASEIRTYSDSSQETLPMAENDFDKQSAEEFAPTNTSENSPSSNTAARTPRTGFGGATTDDRPRARAARTTRSSDSQDGWYAGARGTRVSRRRKPDPNENDDDQQP